VNVVVIECPYCDEDIELNDEVYGMFECPFCGDDFEWNRESAQTKGLFGPWDFWIGLICPFLPSGLGILFSLVFFYGWDSVIGVFLSFLIWPLVALGFAIFGFIKKVDSWLFGAIISLVLSILSMFLLLSF
jgi:predicted RNA-binding Zn-ribbon protein involved in translation (DUF1610 family)